MSKTKIWVTKYALTDGIIERDADEIIDGMALMRGHHGLESYHGKDWHLTRNEAVFRAHEMRSRRLESLQKQINRIEDLRFDEEAR